MEKRNQLKDGGDQIDALLERSAKNAQKAAKACRTGGGGLACLSLDISAALIRNAKAVGEVQARGGDAAALGAALSAVPAPPVRPPPPTTSAVPAPAPAPEPATYP